MNYFVIILKLYKIAGMHYSLNSWWLDSDLFHYVKIGSRQLNPYNLNWILINKKNIPHP